MAKKDRYLVLWKLNPATAAARADPEGRLKRFEKNLDLIKKARNKGKVKDSGYFNATEGFSIIEADENEQPDKNEMPSPEDLTYLEYQVRKIIPQDEGDEIVRKTIRGRGQ